MKATYTCILSAALLVSTICLTSHTMSQENDNNEHNKIHNHSISQLATHQVIPVQALVFTIEAAQGIGSAASSVFKGSCSIIEKNKVNWINIKNMLNDSLRFAGLYMAEGELYQNGQPIVRKDQTIRWVLGQKASAFTQGTKGIIVYRIRDGSNNSLLVYFNNPTGISSWNSFGACIMPQAYQDQQIPLTQDIMKKQFNLILSQLSNPPNSCILVDNGKSHNIPQYEKYNKLIKSFDKQYNVGLYGKYEETKQFLINCYRQQVVAVISSP